jgi:hypothetical protein
VSGGTAGFEQVGLGASGGLPEVDPLGLSDPLSDLGSSKGGYSGDSGVGRAPRAEPNQGTFSHQGTGGFPAQSYQGDIYRGGSQTGSPGGLGSAPEPEHPTEFIPRFGRTNGGPTSTGSMNSSAPINSSLANGIPLRVEADPAQLTGPIGADGRRDFGERPAQATAGQPSVADSGPSTAISSAAELFAEDDDDAEDGAAGRPDGAEESDEEPLPDVVEPGSRPFRRLFRRKGRKDQADSDDAPGAAELDEPAEPARSATPEDVPAGLGPEDADLDERPRAGGLSTWLSLIGQWVFGAIGGAALWIGFRYLWLHVPVLALAASVAATAGLVLLVRAIRRSDDLQTTLLAVLVGLVVTISPAVLLLALR